MKSTCNLLTAVAMCFAVHTSQAGYNTPGTNIQTVLTGTVDNGAMYIQSVPTWLNATPAPGGLQPYTNTTSFVLPAATDIVLGRILFTFWGATPNYTNAANVSFNGTSLASLTFGTTTDTNPMYSATQPNVYGSGLGPWLVSVPVTASLVHTDGTPNTVTIAESLPTVDGRLLQVTFLSVYQDALTLNNQFSYSIAEGSGDIYGNPASGPGRTDFREVALGLGNPANVSAATLTALYTYGTAGENDQLRFNDTALGGSGSNDVANWSNTLTGTNQGPNLVSFDVKGHLNETNTARFTVALADVSGTREGTLRPSMVALGITTIPEPSTFLLVGLGLGALLLRRRKS
ncbi:MAG: hypothetical protein PCFJNLEI_03822 [Verrucomicrobiae bacterium]|nr:hypothetical protein [Verrucomicrobiae bacterium]